MKRLIVTIFLICCAKSAFAQYDTLQLHNPAYDIVALLRISDGRFLEGTFSPRRPLLYGFPPVARTVPWSSHFNLRVDGTTVSNSDNVQLTRVPPTYLTQITPDVGPTINGDTTGTCRYSYGGVQCWQILKPTSLGPGSNTLLIKYIVHNTDSRAHDVGILLEMDTQINTNDSARISTSSGYANREQEFYAPNVPTYWQAFEQDPFQPPSFLVGQGDMVGGEAIMPDRFILGPKRRPGTTRDNYGNVVWDYDTIGGVYDDSGVLLWWYPQHLEPGDSMAVGTYYGTGQPRIQDGDLPMVVANPTPLWCQNCQITPNPFDINLLTTYHYVRGSHVGMVTNLEATITLPPGLTLVAPSTATENMNPPSIDSNAVASCSWRVQADGSVTGNLAFDVAVRCHESAVASNHGTWHVEIPSTCNSMVPRAQVVYPDTCGRIYCCPNLPPAWRFTSLHGLQDTSVVLRVNGAQHHIGDPGVSWTTPDIRWTNPSPWANAETVTTSLLHAVNDQGCNLEPVPCSFIIDLHPPVIATSTPATGSVQGTLTPTFTFNIADSLAGVDSGSLLMTLNGAPLLLGDPGVTWSWAAPTGALGYNSAVAPFRDGDTVRFCITQCFDLSLPMPALGCNRIPMSDLPQCITVTIDVGPPHATLICPTDGSIRSCTGQGIYVRIADANSVEDSTVVFYLNGTPYRNMVDPRMGFDGSMASFRPATDFFSHGEVVHVRVGAGDRVGNYSDSLLGFQFTVDSHAPVLQNPQPSPGSAVATLDPAISLMISDVPAGVQRNSIRVEISTVRGNRTLDLSNPALSFTGGVLAVDWSMLGLALAGGDSVSLCVTAGDAVDTSSCMGVICPSNVDSLCWTFSVGGAGPIASLVQPHFGWVVACPRAPFVFTVVDTHGVIADSIIMGVQGLPHIVGDGATVYSHDTVRYTPPADWLDQDTIRGAVTAARDSLYNRLSAPVSTWFIADRTGPRIGFASPFGQTIDDPSPLVSIFIRDSFTAVPPTSISIVIAGRTLTVDGTMVTFIGDSVMINTAALGFRFHGGDTVQVCVTANDSPDTCGPNVSNACSTFVISSAGPLATVIYPDSGVTTCADQSVRFCVADRQGVDPAGFRVVVDGIDYTWPNSALTWQADSGILTWHPAGPVFSHNEAARVVLNGAMDSLGNAMTDSAVATFIVDLLPPVLGNISPATGSTVADRSPDLILTAIDLPAGLDRDSLRLNIAGLELRLSDPSLTLNGDTLVANGRLAGFSFCGGETVQVLLRAWDHPTITDCPPHEDSLLTWFTIDTGGPRARIISPRDSILTSCPQLGAIFALRDPHGIDPYSIRVAVNEVAVSYPNASLAWTGDSLLTFTPTWTWTSGETIRVQLLAARDLLCNALADTGLSVMWVADLQPPFGAMIRPMHMSEVRTRFGASVLIQFVFGDSLSAVNLTGAHFTLAPSGDYPYGTPGVTRHGDTLDLDPNAAGIVLAEGETIRVCLAGLVDSPDTCPPNAAPAICDSFLIYDYKPNFKVFDLRSFPDNAQEGGRIHLAGKVVNNGEENAACSLWLQVSDSVWHALEMPALNIGDSFAFEESSMVTTLWHTLCAYADPHNAVPETSETDNRACLDVAVRPAPCRDFPDPITPNNDGINDQVTLWYADWSLGTAEIRIYSDQNRLVRQLPSGVRIWDATDENRKVVPGGVYLFVITDGGKTVCSGTITVIR